MPVVHAAAAQGIDSQKTLASIGWQVYRYCLMKRISEPTSSKEQFREQRRTYSRQITYVLHDEEIPSKPFKREQLRRLQEDNRAGPHAKTPKSCWRGRNRNWADVRTTVLSSHLRSPLTSGNAHAAQGEIEPRARVPTAMNEAAVIFKAWIDLRFKSTNTESQGTERNA